MNTNINMFMFWFIQVMTIHNAISLGWNVKKIGSNKYELSIKKGDEHTSWNIPCLEKIINDIISYRVP
ncbi:MAG: hypothetical protein MUO21_09685 [Nitrososphaeraceae archaeon]|nr:hypothetical protein [Nitrososphaeraceae archaeon]